jgi:hypothetical protein
MYDTNTLDSTFSGSYTAGRLVAVQNTGFIPSGYVSGIGGNGANVPSSVQFIEMYGYTQAGLTSGKRLQVQESFTWYKNNNPEQSTQNLNLDAAYTYDLEGKVTSLTYPTTFSYSQTGQLITTPGPKYTYSFDSMDRPTGLTDQSNNTDVSNVTYNAANQLLGLSYFGISETRQYNNLNQMTNLTVGSLINISRADKQTGIADTTLATLGFFSPVTWAYGQWGGNTIFINNASEWMNFGSGFAMYTMFHEMLHVAALGGDTQIEAAFGISQTLVQQQGTMSITNKLMTECGH